MSTDHHLEDNADDQRRIRGHQSTEATGAMYGDLLAGPAIAPTPEHIRRRHDRRHSALTEGSVRAGRDLRAGEVLVDQIGPKQRDLDHLDRPQQMPRVVGADIPAGSPMEIRADGRVYPVDEEAGDLADQLTDAAASAAAVDQVDQALDDTGTRDYEFAEAIVGLMNSKLQGSGLALEIVEACTGCGCTETFGCPDGCYWISGEGAHDNREPRCSSCGPPDGAPTEEPRTPATIAGIEIHTDDSIEPGILELRDHEGNTLARITLVTVAREPDVAGAVIDRIHGDGLTPYAAAASVTRCPVCDKPLTEHPPCPRLPGRSHG